MSCPDVTVVLCTYNRCETLRDALDSLMCQDTGGTFSYEVIVVDDASTDATPDIMRAAVARSPVPMRCVAGSGGGMACAQNKGIRESSTEWIAFFDDDAVAEPTWLRELLACAAETNAEVVGGAVRLLLPDAEVQKISPICRLTLGATEEGRELGRCIPKGFPPSMNLLVRETVFKALGQFDESMTRGGSDCEFGARVCRAGIEAWFTPRAIVHHDVPAYRLKESYLLWRDQRNGDNFAFRDFGEWGLARTVITCLARIAQAASVNVPLMLIAYISGDRGEVLGRKCRLLRAWGYIRETLYLISPQLFSQKSYFSRLDMRREQNTLAGTTAAQE